MRKSQSHPVHAASRVKPTQEQKKMEVFREVLEEWLSNVDKFIFNNKEVRDPVLMIVVKPTEMKTPCWEGIFNILRRQDNNKRLISFVSDMKKVFMKLVPENVIQLTQYDIDAKDSRHVIVSMTYSTVFNKSVEYFSICIDDFLCAGEFRKWIIKCLSHYFILMSKMIQLLIAKIYCNPEALQMQFPLIRKIEGDFEEVIVLNPFRRGIIVEEEDY